MRYSERNIPTDSTSRSETSFNSFADACVITLAPYFEVVTITVGRSSPSRNSYIHALSLVGYFFKWTVNRRSLAASSPLIVAWVEGRLEWCEVLWL